MKKIITFLSLMLCMFATAQEVGDTMYVYRSDNVIERIPVTKIDSITFVSPVVPVTPPSTSQYEAVDLGLPSGVKWASFNVGATKPEEYGGYYAWGETEEKDDYSWSTYKYSNGNANSIIKYCTNATFGISDDKSVLDPSDDVAHVIWGYNWRMPTADEQKELMENCTWKWGALNGINGYTVTGSNGNSIFLPAAGYREGTELMSVSGEGTYLSASLYNDDNSNACGFAFFIVRYFVVNPYRCNGYTVRPVCN